MRTTPAWVLAVLLSVSACAVGDEDDAQTTEHTATTTAPDVATPSVGPSALVVAYQSGGTVRVRTADGGLVDVGVGVEGEPQHPDWSPDGTRLAFETDFAIIWTVAADGSDAREVYRCAGRCFAVQDPAWSPDGRQLAFVEAQTRDGVHESKSLVRVVDLGTGKVRDVTADRSGSETLFGPRWSDDGSSLVVEEDVWASTRLDESVLRGARLVTMGADGHDRRVLASWKGPISGPASPAPDWSGKRVVFVRDDNLLLIDVDDGSVRPLTTYDGVTEHAIQPTFSQDGRRITFTYVRGSFEVDDRPEGAVVDVETGVVTMLDLPGATHVRLGPG